MGTGAFLEIQSYSDKETNNGCYCSRKDNILNGRGQKRKKIQRDDISFARKLAGSISA